MSLDYRRHRLWQAHQSSFDFGSMAGAQYVDIHAKSRRVAQQILTDSSVNGDVGLMSMK